MSSSARSRTHRFLLPAPQYNLNHLPIPYHEARSRSFSRASQRLQSILNARNNLQIVQEFRSKLQRAEEMISKLAFSLREIQGVKRKPKDESNKKSSWKLGTVIPAVKSPFK